MGTADDWVRVPGLFEDLELAELSPTFELTGVEFQTQTVNLGVTMRGGRHMHELHVMKVHAPIAAWVLRDYFEVVDPEEEVAFCGPCPACGEELVDAWSCPSCEISLRLPYDKDDPLVVFVKEHGAFERP